MSGGSDNPGWYGSYRTCLDCRKERDLVFDKARKIIYSPCEWCISPGAVMQVSPGNESALEVYGLASSQVITIGGGMAPSVPVDLDLKSLEVALKVLEFPLCEWRDLIERVRELYSYTLEPRLLEPDLIRMEEESWEKRERLVLTFDDL